MPADHLYIEHWHHELFCSGQCNSVQASHLWWCVSRPFIKIEHKNRGLLCSDQWRKFKGVVRVHALFLHEASNVITACVSFALHASKSSVQEMQALLYAILKLCVIRCLRSGAIGNWLGLCNKSRLYVSVAQGITKLKWQQASVFSCPWLDLLPVV